MYRWLQYSPCRSGGSVVTLCAAVIANLGCGAVPVPSLSDESIPAALRVVRSNDFESPPASTLTSATLVDADKAGIDDLIGCWGARNDEQTPDAEALELNIKAFHAYVITASGFRQQQLIELNGRPVFLADFEGTLGKADNDAFRFQYEGESRFDSSVALPWPSDLTDGTGEEDVPYQDIFVTIDGDLMTLLWVYDDGTEETQVYRRFECP